MLVAAAAGAAGSGAAATDDTKAVTAGGKPLPTRERMEEHCKIRQCQSPR